MSASLPADLPLPASAASLPFAAVAVAVALAALLLLPLAVVVLPVLRTKLGFIAMERRLAHIPSPPRPPNASALGFFFRGHTAAMEEFVNMGFAPVLLGYRDEYANPLLRYRFFLGEPRVLITKPEHVRHVAVTRQGIYQKPAFLVRVTESLLGKTSIVLATDDAHRRLKKVVHPAFHFDAVLSCAPAFLAEARRTVDLLLEHAALPPAADPRWVPDGKDPAVARVVADPRESIPPVDFSSLAGSLAMRVVGVTGFGYRESEEEDREFLREYRAQLEFSPGGRYIIARIMIPKWIFAAVVPAEAEQDRRKEKVRAGLKRLIQRRRDEMAAAAAAKGGGAEVRSDLLTMMLRANMEGDAVLTEDELVDQAQTFMTAGQVTTAATISFVIMEVTRDPAIRERLVKEIDPLAASILKPRAEAGALLTEDDAECKALLKQLDELPYLEAVVKEALRVYPPATLTPREALEDDYIDGVFIPKGVTVTVPMHMIMIDPTIWGPDAAKYRPERWLDPATGQLATPTKAQAMAYMPFLHGPRSCIGSRFALYEAKVAVAALFSAFVVERPDDFVEPKLSGMVPIPQKMGIRFVPRPDNIAAAAAAAV